MASPSRSVDEKGSAAPLPASPENPGVRRLKAVAITLACACAFLAALLAQQAHGPWTSKEGAADAAVGALVALWADAKALPEEDGEAMTERAEAALSIAQIDEDVIGLRLSSAPGWVEILHQSGPTLISQDGGLLIQGRILDVRQGIDLSAVRRAEVEYAQAVIRAALDPIPAYALAPPAPLQPNNPQRAPQPDATADTGPSLAAINDPLLPTVQAALWDTEGMLPTLDYLADDERLQVLVFSRPECPHCQRLHAALPDLNALGVSVRYLFIPQSPAERQKVVNALCALNPAEAMSSVYAGGEPPPCEDSLLAENRVEAHAHVAQLINVTSTPTLYPALPNPASVGFDKVDELLAAWNLDG